MEFQSVEWPSMWYPTDAQVLVDELKREGSRGHVLHDEEVSTIARCDDGDDVLYFLVNKNSFAVVHLTWANQPESPPWPMTKIFKTFDEFAAENFDDQE